MEPESMILTDVEASRRRFLQLAGVTGTAALAGCTGDDSTSDSEETQATSR